MGAHSTIPSTDLGLNSSPQVPTTTFQSLRVPDKHRIQTDRQTKPQTHTFVKIKKFTRN